MTPAEAGEHGRKAGARRLVLTHFSDELDADWAREEAERTFGGPVELAARGRRLRRSRHCLLQPRAPTADNNGVGTGDWKK